MKAPAATAASAGIVLAVASLAATAAGRLRNPALVVGAALLLAWSVVMLLNATAVDLHFRAALAANETAVDPVVVEYIPGIAYLVDGDPVFQALCEINSPAKSGWLGTSRFSAIRGLAYALVSIGIPAILTGIVTARRPTKAFYVVDAYCDQDVSKLLNLLFYVLIPVAFSLAAVALILLSLRSYARRRREIMDSVTAQLLARRRANEEAADAAAAADSVPQDSMPLPPTSIATSTTPRHSQLTPRVPQTMPAPSGVVLHRDEDDPAALMGLLQFMQRMMVWCSLVSLLSLAYVAVSLVDIATDDPLSGYAGESQEFTAIALYEPPVAALALFLCFGTGWSARSGYAAVGRALRRAIRLPGAAAPRANSTSASGLLASAAAIPGSSTASSSSATYVSSTSVSKAASSSEFVPLDTLRAGTARDRNSSSPYPLSPVESSAARAGSLRRRGSSHQELLARGGTSTSSAPPLHTPALVQSQLPQTSAAGTSPWLAPA
ncbi:hypothetical protein HK405_007899 [Cladochytrium tenue]|nr:hypothetical protein HK405_007899 [Cladochytrium tenue]